MNKMKRHIKALIIAIIIIAAIVLVLLTGPIFINWIFVTETVDWNIHWTFTAGEILQYYGAILGGLVMGLAIIVSIHINNLNLKHDRQRTQFERAYELYHRLPEILAKLEITAIHVQYSVNLNEDKLMETLDAMKESESILREQHFANDVYYNKTVDLLIKKIIIDSVKCQESVEQFLNDKKNAGEDINPSADAMEDAFSELRESIKTAKSEIVAEIGKFISSEND